MIQVKKELVTPESNIHGKYYHKIDYIDQYHLSPETYVCGNYNERNFSIPLIKKPELL